MPVAIERHGDGHATEPDARRERPQGPVPGSSAARVRAFRDPANASTQLVPVLRQEPEIVSEPTPVRGIARRSPAALPALASMPLSFHREVFVGPITPSIESC